MKKLLVAGAALAVLIGTPAFAADMALKAPPPPPAPIFSWTGFYIGGELGGAWANGHVTDSLFGLDASSSHDGWLGGAVVGYNYQTSNVVFGIEADFDWTSLNATGNGVFIPAVGTLQASAKTDWITTVAGRVGFAAADRALIYVKGGGGWVGNTASITNLSHRGRRQCIQYQQRLVDSVVGWSMHLLLIGPARLSSTISAFVAGAGTRRFFRAIRRFTASRNITMVKAGLNYRFGWNGGQY